MFLLKIKAQKKHFCMNWNFFLEFLFPGEKKENYQRNFSLKNLPTSCCHPYIFPANKCYDNIYVQSKNPLRLPIVWINLSHPSHDLSVKHTAPCDVYWLTQCVTPSSYWCLPVARYWCQFPREIYRTGNINFMKDLCSHVTCTISQHQSGEINPNFLNTG